MVVASGDQQIALARNADGSVVAHTAICTHQGCTVKAAGATLSCPCHGSAFDAFTGAATKAPATVALDAIKVSVSGDTVYLV
ncbi:MAG: Rieske (2Fe-2S) protein [Nakamurella sp.]